MIGGLVMRLSHILVIGVRCGERCGVLSDEEEDCFRWEGCRLNVDKWELKMCLHAGLLLTHVWCVCDRLVCLPGMSGGLVHKSV